MDGTASELITDIIDKTRNKGIEHLIIITDGSVNTDNIDKSDYKMNSLKKYINYKFVSTYIIANSGGDRSTDEEFQKIREHPVLDQ